MKATLSFNNSQAEKDELEELILSHELADSFRQGLTWDAKIGKGCSIGCVNHDYSYTAIAEKYGVPLFFVRNADTIFEGLPVDKSKTFTRKYWQHVPVGANADYFKSLYHFICFNQIKRILVNLKYNELAKLLADCLVAHCKKSDDVQDLQNILHSYARSFASADASADAFRFADAFAKPFRFADAFAKPFCFADTFHSARASAIKFTMGTTIKGLQMTQSELDNFLLGEIKFNDKGQWS